jgi:hypothetical protein
MTMTTEDETRRAAWHAAQDAHTAAIDAYGFDDPRTVAAEAAELDALLAYWKG